MGERSIGTTAGTARARWPVAVLAAALTGLLIAIVPTGATSQEAETSPRARVSSPEPWRAYPLNQVERNLDAQAEQDACDFESRQGSRRRALLIFLFGRASRQDGTFGVGPDDSFRSNDRIERALLAAADAYARCRSDQSKQVDIAYGATDYELTQEINTQRGAREWGEAQRDVIEKVAGRAPNGVGTAMAGDIEPGWNPNGSDLALSLMRGAADGPGDVYNFGTAGKCRPFGDGCQGDWTYEDIGRVSQDSGIIALPQIYYPRQAKTWARVADRWDLAGDNCPRASERDCYRFGGVTSHPKGCSDVEFTPRQSWMEMRNATRRPVGRRLIYFNPRRVSCGDNGRSELPARSSSGVGDTGYRLPLMPEEVPAEFVEDPEPVVSSDMMSPIENAWRVGSHREYTWVFAGGAGLDPVTGAPSPDGKLIITRERYRRDRPTTPTIETIEIPGAGPLRISGAPLGARHATTAHRSATLAFESASGVTGTLDLATTSVEFEPVP